MQRTKFLIAVDVGNTAVSTGLFEFKSENSVPSLKNIWTFSTRNVTSSISYARFLRGRLKNISTFQFLKPIVSSVVPGVDPYLRSALRSITQQLPFFVTASLPSRIKVRYGKPSEVGADRLVNARAAIEKNKGPNVVIDFGTATTFDCVSARSEYLGGVIAPGPFISAEALYHKTAKLPMVLLDKPARILGRNTLESIQAGLYHGYRGLVKEIVARLKDKMGPRTKIFATGGQAKWILNGLSVVDYHIPTLTLQGLYLYWKDQQVDRLPRKGGSR